MSERKRLIWTSAVDFPKKREFPGDAVFAIIGPFASHEADADLQEAIAEAIRNRAQKTVPKK